MKKKIIIPQGPGASPDLEKNKKLRSNLELPALQKTEKNKK